MDKYSTQLTAISSLICSALLAGCGGGSSGGSNPDQPVELQDFDTGSITTTPGEMSDFSTPVELTENVLEMTFQIPGARFVNPRTQYGSVSIVSDNTLRYTFDSSYLDTYQSQLSLSGRLNSIKSAPIHYIGKKVTDKEDQIFYIDKDNNYRTVSIPFYSDPLLWAQWHIKNNGKSLWIPYPTVYDLISEYDTVGVDLNILPVWAQGITGSGVTVAVVDEDMEIAHEDLRENVNVELSYNVLDGRHDPTFDPDDPTLKKRGHGTSVSGIIAASKNNVGVRGIAYNAKLAGFNLMHPAVDQEEVIGETEAVVENDILDRIIAADIQVVNESFGAQNGLFVNSYNPLLDEQVLTLAEKKVVIVKSMGNEYDEPASPDKTIATDSECSAPTKSTGTVDCFVNFSESYYAHPLVITAGALGFDGKHASYGSTGSNLVLSTFGGDDPPTDIVTTDRTGCDLGYTRFSEADSDTEYDKCRYNSSMNGTSSAAPEITGAIALIKSANPELSTLQTKYVLIKSARILPVMEEDQQVQTKLGTTSITNHLGWVKNQAGFSFNNKFGFGLPDVANAVTRAQLCEQDPECVRRANIDDIRDVEISELSACTLDTDNGYYHYTCTFTGDLKDTDGNNLDKMRIEAAGINLQQLYFLNKDGTRISGIENDNDAQDEFVYNALTNLQVQLTSPAGTTSIIKHLHSCTGGIAENSQLLTNAFYQEDTTTGDYWTLELISDKEIDIDTDQKLKLSLDIFGFAL